MGAASAAGGGEGGEFVVGERAFENREAAEQAGEGVGDDAAGFHETAAAVALDPGRTGHGADGEVCVALEQAVGITEGVAPVVALGFAHVEPAVEVGAGVSAVVADGDALPAVERHGRGADGDVHAVGVAGGGAAVGGDVCADLLRGVPDFEVDEHAVLTAVVFVPDAGDELAAAVAGGLAFDPGDDGDLRVG